ncbi:MAG: sigma-70 family RNA polymerase sigma factor [Bacteroidales bacterium]|nr:sigma-70 family RNA polymerase sigma factor [Bacteroidales bacterium]MBR5092474.1 sigma-70 family RNA polymerase sigma factor [Bacteroidales bacterium]
METATTDRMQHDYQLVCAARDHGSHKAYADLMAAYREPLYLLLLRMTHNTTVADDLTIETFGKAFLQLHRYAPTSTFSSWLYTIGINTYIDSLRRNHLDTVPLSSAQRDSEGDFIEYQIPSNQPNPEESLIRMQRDETLKQLVDQLKEPYRRIIRMRYYEDLSYEEIAQQLNLPLGTVKVRLMRAKNLLAAVVEKKRVEI